jgi:hypothetical protein
MHKILLRMHNGRGLARRERRPTGARTAREQTRDGRQ